MESYYESAHGITITKARALKELANHGITSSVTNVGDGLSLQEFYAEMGDCETYNAQAVLGYLGY